MRVKRQKSIAWDHFSVSEKDPKKAICRHCPKHKNSYAYTNGGTKNLLNHLNSQHKGLINGESLTLPRQQFINDFKPSLFNFSQKEFEHRLIDWIVTDDQSFQVVENEKFKMMISSIKPGVHLFSGKTLKRRLMDIFQEKRAEQIANFEMMDSKVSFTTDCWTAPNSIAFMGITAHYIDCFQVERS